VLRGFAYGEGIDNPLALMDYGDTGKTYFYHTDALGSVLALSGPGGGLANVYRYDAFGNIEVAQRTVHNDLTFTGRPYDADSNTYDFRARQMDPSLGRFLQTDPRDAASFEMSRTSLASTLPGLTSSLTDLLKLPDLLNAYTYALNNPLSYNDPSGESYCDETCPFDGFLYAKVTGLIGFFVGIVMNIIFFIVGTIYALFSLICTLDSLANSNLSGGAKVFHALINVLLFTLGFVLGIVALAPGGFIAWLFLTSYLLVIFSLVYSLFLNFFILGMDSMDCLIFF